MEFGMNIYEYLRPNDLNKLKHAVNQFNHILITGHELDCKEDFIRYFLKSSGLENKILIKKIESSLDITDSKTPVIFLCNSRIEMLSDKYINIFCMELLPIQALGIHKLIGSMSKRHQIDKPQETIANLVLKHSHGLSLLVINNINRVVQNLPVLAKTNHLNHDLALALASFMNSFKIEIPISLPLEEITILDKSFFLKREIDSWGLSQYAHSIEGVEDFVHDDLSWSQIELLQKLKAFDLSKSTELKVCILFLEKKYDSVLKIVELEYLNFKTEGLLQRLLTRINPAKLSSNLLIHTLQAINSQQSILLEEVIIELEQRYAEQLLNKEQKMGFLTSLKLRSHISNQDYGYGQNSNVESIQLFETSLSERKKGRMTESIDLLTRAISIIEIGRIRTEFENAQAINYLQDAQYEKAIILFEEVKKSFKDLSLGKYAQIASFNQAISYHHKGEIGKAHELIKLIEQDGVIDPALRYSITNYNAFLALKKGDYQEAYAKVKTILSSHGVGHSQMIFALDYEVEILIRQGKYEYARGRIEHLQTFIFEHDQLALSIMSVKNQAYLSFKTNNVILAKDTLKELISIKMVTPRKYQADILVSEFYLTWVLDVKNANEKLNEIDRYFGQDPTNGYLFDTNLFKSRINRMNGNLKQSLEELETFKKTANKFKMDGRIDTANEELVSLYLELYPVGQVFDKINEFKNINGKNLFYKTVLSSGHNRSELENNLFELTRELNLSENESKLNICEKALINTLIFNFRLEERINYIVHDKLSVHESEVLRGLGEKLGVLREDIIIIDSQSSKNISVQEYLQDLQHIQKHDLVFDEINSCITLFGVKLDIAKDQVLYRFMLFFLENNLSGHTKEAILSHVWNEDYNPIVHDAYIYQVVHKIKNLLKARGQSAHDLIIASNEQYSVNNAFDFVLVTKKLAFNMSLNKRQLWALNFLKYNEKLTAAHFSSENNTSLRTAQRDLAELVDNGNLLSIGKGKSLFYQML